MLLYICNVSTCRERQEVKQIHSFIMSLGRDERGQDLIEYALMAGFVAVAAGAIMPGVTTQISIIFSKVNSALTDAATP